MICYLYEAPILFKLPLYIFYTPDLPALLYYSHIPTTLIALIVGFFVFFNAPNRLLNRILLLITICFSLWTSLSLLAWTNINADFLAFIWPFFAILASLLSILSIYFISVFLHGGEDVSNLTKITFLLLLVPVLILAPTDLSVSGFNLVNCGAFEYEGLLYKIYYNSLGFIAMGWILILLINAYKKATHELRTQIILMGIGVEFFLFSFITTIFIVTSFLGMEVFENTIFDLDDTSAELYGLFGMSVFMIMMSSLIVRSRLFKVKAHGAEVLTIALLLLVGSQYTFPNANLTTTLLTTVTITLTALAGAILIRSVRKEVKQREQLEILTKKLEKANKRLKVLDQLKSEFVSIASHQLRSPLTSVRGYASMLLEGTYGKLSEKAQDAVERIAESSRMMALSVEDYLNVSRIQAGNMKYVYSDFNLPDMASHIVDDVRRDAIKKGLVLSFKSDMNAKGVVHADNGKTMQILHNLINNAVKYTPKGTVTVFAHDKGKRVFIDVIDSGIGMSPETIENIFAKFERAKNANEVNVTGTGLGLYVAQKMAEEMGGDIEAFSDGEGKGSTFRLTLPLQM